MSVIGLIGKYRTGTYEVTRRPKGVRVDGVYQPANNPTTLQVVARVRSPYGRELQDLPEGQRADNTIVMLTTTELKTRTADFDPDVVVVEGDEYRVEGVNNPEAFGDTHYRCMLVRTTRP